jgi:bifunctional oligoribonuclease and PAP phosphatase NrnA
MPDSKHIFTEIEKANSILLHCHPSPDPDSLGSVLATKFALESLGKKVTVIQGDSEIPPAFMHFPGAAEIEKKNFWDVSLDNFDLFLILDSGSPEMVSRKQHPVFPLSIKSIVIDHHASNTGYGDINYIVSAPSTTYILYGLFKEWGISITPEIASNLFIGMYTDTGGFKYPPTDYKVFEAAAELSKISPNFIEIISKMENSQDKNFIYGQAIALSSLHTYHNDRLVISAVSHEALSEKKISTNAISEGHIANILKSVIGWDIAVSMVEIEPGRVKASFRSVIYDVSKLASELGGGGHKAAAGAVLTTSLSEAMAKVVDTAKVLYNL